MIRSLLLAAGFALFFSGCCIDRMSGRYCGPDGCQSDCNACGPGCSDCPYGCNNRSFLNNMLGCCAGCGEIYWNEWANDPPDCCDPCDGCGHYTGPRCCPPRPLYNGWCHFWGYRNGCGGRGSCGGSSCGGCDSCGGCGSCGSCGNCGINPSGVGGTTWGGDGCGLWGGRNACGTSCGKYGCSTGCSHGGCSTCGGGYGEYASYGGHSGCATCNGGGGHMTEGMSVPTPMPSAPATPTPAPMTDPFKDDPEQAAPAPVAPKNSRQPTPAKRITQTAPQYPPQMMASNQPMVRPWKPVRPASTMTPRGVQVQR